MANPFPKSFLWGSSTNAQQFEGGRDEGGAGTSIADVRVLPGYEDADFSGFKTAADHYHHLEEDLDLYAEMGFGKRYGFVGIFLPEHSAISN